MATVDQGINLQSSAAVNVSTINFLPAVPASSWTPAAAPHHHHHHDSATTNYAAIWEPTTTSNPGHEEEASAGQAHCMNLMERMAYTQHNLIGPTLEGTGHGAVNWAAAKYEDRDDEKLGDPLLKMKMMDEQYSSNYVSPNSINMSSHNDSSEVVQLVVNEEGSSNASDHHVYPHHHGFLLASPSSLLQQKRHRDHATPPHSNSSAPPHEIFDSQLQKKQRATPATKEALNNEDQATSGEVGPALNTNGRPRAKRGSATDPQSVYARQRRERINERLKILQNLVPNGAKVDIVTMLEEAISYVKFLQLQVKLLSSDEYWMYAPTTYNGIDVSFDMLQHST
ncbi:hypothetical protein GOP47_0006049 [Adiantum capillus-veneris]|uniref:BHLH domain-containing protein n=1 Tax=Adiantum capillus-veneris TaxID=13818 RepID=A0A9D4V335_ADICA|nr:hypothetical protein GOP47_0006049 [Adiantum capillus-veneris]